MSQLKVIVPARMGSKRVRCKNLRLLNGKPLIGYVLETLKKTRHLNDVVINSDSERYGQVAERYGVGFYQRRPELGTSESLIDDYIYDYMQAETCDYLAVVNPTSPFMSAADLDRAWEYFQRNDFNTLLSCEKIQTHSFYKGEAINFSTQGQHPRSQDIEPVLALNFAISIWNCRAFRQNYESNGYGVYTPKLGFWHTDGLANVDIDYEDDFMLAEHIARTVASGDKPQPAYSDIIHDLVEKNIDLSN